MFKIDEFDVEDMNYRIKKIPSIFKEKYEQDLYPTLGQVNVIERNYQLLRKKPIVPPVKVTKKRKKRKKKK